MIMNESGHRSLEIGILRLTCQHSQPGAIPLSLGNIWEDVGMFWFVTVTGRGFTGVLATEPGMLMVL